MLRVTTLEPLPPVKVPRDSADGYAHDRPRTAARLRVARSWRPSRFGSPAAQRSAFCMISHRIGALALVYVALSPSELRCQISLVAPLLFRGTDEPLWLPLAIIVFNGDAASSRRRAVVNLDAGGIQADHRSGMCAGVRGHCTAYRSGLLNEPASVGR